MLHLVVSIQAGWDRLEQLQTSGVARGRRAIVISTDQRPFSRVAADPERYGGSSYIATPWNLDTPPAMVDRLMGPLRGAGAHQNEGRSDDCVRP